MTIVELLNHVGLDNVRVQPLSPALKEAHLSKKGETLVTFYTREITPNDLLFGGKGTVGMILWLPADRLPTPQSAPTHEASGNAKKEEHEE